MKKEIATIIRKYAKLAGKDKPHLTYKSLKAVYKKSNVEDQEQFIKEAKRYIMMHKSLKI